MTRLPDDAEVEGFRAAQQQLPADNPYRRGWSRDGTRTDASALAEAWDRGYREGRSLPQGVMTMEPGIYTGLPVARYFADPAPEPSLTQSLAKLIVAKSPLHAWYAHSRLNPDYKEDDDSKFDLGNTAHTLLIGRGKDVVALDFDHWRTKEAKALREKYRVEGKLAVLGTQYERAQRMVAAAREQLEHRDKGHLFGDIEGGETVLIWQEKIGRQTIYLRTMVDWLKDGIFCDFKTTDMSVAPHALGRLMATAGWNIQAAMAERGLRALGMARCHHYYFCAQETDAPYSLSIAEMSETALHFGHRQLEVAVRIWARCMRDNRWPSYPLQTITPDLPEWHQAEWLNREENEFHDDLLDAG
jgi:hypothetical protein